MCLLEVGFISKLQTCTCSVGKHFLVLGCQKKTTKSEISLKKE